MIAGRYLSIAGRRINIVRKVGFFKKSSKKDNVESSGELTKEEKESIQSIFPNILAKSEKLMKKTGNIIDISSEDAEGITIEEKDTIRARGILPYKYTYSPPSNLKDTIKNVLNEIMEKVEDDFSKVDLTENIKIKAKILIKLGEELNHCIPNNQLHEIKNVEDIYNFYLQPVSNTTEYIQMARDSSKPKNIFMREEAFRFHPDDVEAYHGGITAFPGSGGEVYGLRNKRILRQFNPRKEWYDYEDVSYDYTKIDAGLPWDSRIAEKMDRYVNKKYKLKSLF
uniref:Large ribosomal subunit protein mL50 n=1 Tax=Parastrongyloides trichosuri TaxID=131310 RepID=A0A0N4ZTS5_PARTI